MTDETLSGAVYADLVVGEHRIALLRDGEQAFPAMLEAIRDARSSICLETYILRSDRTGERFAEALIERARAGVEVNVIYDAWGSRVSVSYLRRLHDAGVRTLAYHPFAFDGRIGRMLNRLVRRDHRKMLVVDRRVGFTGGLNIADDYASVADGGGGWRDTHIRLEGPAVLEMLAYFLAVWRKQKGAPLDEARYAHEGRRPDPKVRVIGNGPRRDRKFVRDAYLQAIDNATRRILITNAYFIPTARMMRALKAAARRGVAVELLLAGTTDLPAARFAAHTFYGALLQAGVRIFEWYGRVLHAKTAVVDGRWGTVGSTNLDTLSFRTNLEINTVFEDEGLAWVMEKMFDEDLEQCVEVYLEEWQRRPWLHRMVSWVASLFRRWL
ncbi:MAG TPA: cardiolipin synthase ClsB [Vulgatibacter sp.]|nr:cardiolipin synthase ClsB [Vulgatibacter sp.]